MRKPKHPRHTAPSISLDLLESRQLLSAVYPTDAEQYVLELINRARANPAAEAARYGIDLNEGLKPGTISSAAKQPLAINPYLTDAARDHSQWMIDSDTFSHTGANNTDPQARMKSAGYAFTGSWTWAENIAIRSFKTNAPHNDVYDAVEKDLFVDLGIDDRGHRVNLLSPRNNEVGVGLVSGQFTYFNAAALTQDFASSGGHVFLTGVAFTDAVTKDNFYTPGEGLGGVTVTATRLSDGATFTTQTWSAGGYSLKLDPGTYRVTASGGKLARTIAYDSVTIGSENVKRDFTSAAATQPTPNPIPDPTPTPTPPPATGVPATPSGLVASAASSSSILLTWSDNATNETGYQIERSTDGKTFYRLAGGGANMTRRLDTGLAPGKRYYYRVYATNAAGHSSYSNVVSTVSSSNGGGGDTPTPTPPPPVTPPPPPVVVGAPATPTSLTIRLSTTVAHAIELAWTDAAGSGTSFQIERSTDGKTFYRLAGTKDTFNRNVDLTPGKRYYYRVYAVNAAGKSTYSTVVSIVIPR